MQLLYVGVQFGEITLQFNQTDHLVQRVGEMHVIAVELAQALQLVGIQIGELGREAMQEAAHGRTSGRLRKASRARARLSPRSMIGAG